MPELERHSRQCGPLAKRTRPCLHRVVRGLPLIAFVAVAAPGVALACREIPVCATITTDGIEDAMYGSLSDWYPWRARGIRVTIIRPSPEPPIGMYLDEEGCATFESQFHAGFLMLVYPEAVLGESQNIRIKAFEPLNDTDETVPEVAVVDPLTDENGMIEFEIPPADIWNVMAVATHVIHRVDSAPELGSSLLTGVHDLRIQMTDAPNSSALAIFEAGKNASSHKFIVGHELGHWIQAQVNGVIGTGGAAWNYEYFYDTDVAGAPDAACAFAVAENPPGTLNWHGIRSAEYSSGALTEGYGHFIASVAFNDIGSESGIFRYYKNIDPNLQAYEDFIASGNRVQLKGGDGNALGGESAWVENQCENDWDWPLNSDPLGQEVTSEIDWMRFFWRLVTANEIEFGPAMAFWDVAYLLAYTHETDPWSAKGATYCNVFNALADTQSGLDDFEDRFVNLTDENGVYNGSPTSCVP